MIWVALVFAILGAALGVFLCVYGSNKPLKIKVPYTPFDWFIPVFTSFPWVVTAFIVEYIISVIVVPINVDKATAGYFFIKAYENGLFIPLLSVGVSWLFYNSVKSLNLQYHPLYSDKVPKVCFTVIVISFCVILIFGMLPKYEMSGIEYDLMVNRVLMWALTVVGTWIGFGFGCKSKEEKDNEFIGEDNDGITLKDKLKFNTPILAALVVCIIVMVLYVLGCFFEFLVILVSFSSTFLLFGSMVLLIIRSKRDPSESRSKRIFAKAKNNHKQSGYGEGRCGKLSYCLDKDKLIIKARTIIYEGHEEDKEFRRLFEEKTIPLKSKDKYDNAWKELEKRLEDQDNYIKREQKACLKAEKEKKRVKFK